MSFDSDQETTTTPVPLPYFEDRANLINITWIISALQNEYSLG